MSTPFIRPLGMAHNPQAAAQLVDRVFNEGRADQFKRELVVNSMQAGATKIVVTAVRVEEDGGFKAAFVDNGMGMASTKIADYIGELFAGASTLGPDQNFQMGARVSTLPWNHDGVLVASWTDGEPEGTMIHLRYDDETKTYGVMPFGDPDDDDVPAQPTGVPNEWMKHEIIEEANHGTVVILLGNSPADNTAANFTQSPSGEFVFPTSATNPRDEWWYYNTKFWDLINCNGERVTLRTYWPAQDFRVWRAITPVCAYPEEDYVLPQCPGCDRPSIHGDDGTARPHTVFHRPANGLKRIIDIYGDPARDEDDRFESGSVHVSAGGHGATVHWVLTPISDRGKSGGPRNTGLPVGLFAERKGDELYAIRVGASDTRNMMAYYGITSTDVRDRLVLVVEPDPRPGSKSYGAVPSSSRRQLMIANGSLPHRVWGGEFSRNLPKPIQDRLDYYAVSASLTDAARQKAAARKMEELFGRRPSRRPNTNGLPVGTADTVYGTPNTGSTGTRDPDDTRPPHPPRERSPHGHKPNPAIVPLPEGLQTSAGRKGKPKTPIDSTWDGQGKEFRDTPGVMARFNPSTRQLIVNGRHPVLVGLVNDIAAVRQVGKRGVIEKISQNAVTAFYEDYINGVEMYPNTFANRGLGTSPDDFTDKALTDLALTAIAVNTPMIHSVIVGKFRGVPGLKELTKEELAEQPASMEAQTA